MIVYDRRLQWTKIGRQLNRVFQLLRMNDHIFPYVLCYPRFILWIKNKLKIVRVCINVVGGKYSPIELITANESNDDVRVSVCVYVRMIYRLWKSKFERKLVQSIAYCAILRQNWLRYFSYFKRNRRCFIKQTNKCATFIRFSINVTRSLARSLSLCVLWL